MGVMTQMRDRMKIIMIILVIAFLGTIIFSWGMGYSGSSQAQNILGTIDGQDVTTEQFYQRYNQEINSYRERSGQEITESIRLRVRDQVWESLISEILVSHEIEKLGLEATDEEIYFYLENNPPEFLQNQEDFQTDGVFDHQKYLTALHNPVGNEWYQIEEYFRSIIPSQKLQNLITASVIVGEDEVHDAFAEENVNYEVEYLTVPFTLQADKDIEVSDEEISAYYTENKDEKYAVPEKRILQYVTYKKSPSKEDTVLVQQDMDEVMFRLSEGEKFEDLAKIYCQDGSAERGGDLGWFGRGQMVPVFEDAAFAAPLNKVVGPILTQFGYHLLKVSDKKMVNGKQQVKANHILLRIETGPNTVERLSGDARLFSFDAQDLGFSRALESYKVTADTVLNGVDNKSYYYPTAGLVPQLTRFAFKNKTGTVSDVIETDDVFIVAQLLEVKAPTFKEADLVKGSIERTLKREKKEAYSLNIAKELYNKASQGESLKALANTDSKYTHKVSPKFTLKTPPADLNNNLLIKEAVKDIALNEIAKPVHTTRGYVILQLRSKGEVDESKYKLEKLSLQASLLTAKKNEAVSNYMEALRENVKIIDNRSDFF